MHSYALVGDYWLQNLHLICELQRQLEKTSDSRVQISFLPVSAWHSACEGKPSRNPRAHPTDSHARYPVPNPAAHVGDFVDVSFSGRQSRISVRWCTTWVAALTAARKRDLSPTRLVYAQTELWLWKFGAETERKAAIMTLLNQHQLQLFPPLTWNDITENKDKMYLRFHDHMLKARWENCDPTQVSAATVASNLLMGLSDGQYIVKGQRSTCAQVVAKISVSDGKCSELESIVRDFRDNKFQRGIGIQPYCRSLPGREFRHWCISEVQGGSKLNQFKVIAVVQTGFAGDDTNNALVSKPCLSATLQSLACLQLVEHMLEKHRDYFDHLRQLGMPAIRIDCGYSDELEKPFFNELAPPPDAVLFSHTHSTQLAAIIGSSMARQILSCASQ